MVTASPLFNNLRHSYFWILDGEYEVEKKVYHECQCRNRLNIAHRLKLARELLEGMIEEEAKRLRGCINPPYVRVGTLKEVIDIVQDVRSILDNILTECPMSKRVWTRSMVFVTYIEYMFQCFSFWTVWTFTRRGSCSYIFHKAAI